MDKHNFAIAHRSTPRASAKSVLVRIVKNVLPLFLSIAQADRVEDFFSLLQVPVNDLIFADDGCGKSIAHGNSPQDTRIVWQRSRDLRARGNTAVLLWSALMGPVTGIGMADDTAGKQEAGKGKSGIEHLALCSGHAADVYPHSSPSAFRSRQWPSPSDSPPAR
ncbi:MAG: hypothetical protein R3F19_25840 [Verrucomicrobiales bacterium]